MSDSSAFQPGEPLCDGATHPSCRAIVILPARNEERSIAASLGALAAQVDLHGQPLPATSYEVLLLLNNCTDQSASVATRWAHDHPTMTLTIIERTLPSDIAHVGTARRLLMDTAWRRLVDIAPDTTAILSTDSDTLVAPDWIARNLFALQQGADAVGGTIGLLPGDLESLPYGVRRSYLCDRRYQQRVARLESILDPQQGDPWPRHMEHFGASLACTPQIYARAGGMPAIKPLEDVAFVDALRRVDATLRHDPDVRVYTSSRMEGRVEIGLSQQLSEWQQMSENGQEHMVPTAAWLIHRFRSLSRLRALYARQHITIHDLGAYPEPWRDRILDAHRTRTSVAGFLGEIDCNGLIEALFRGRREGVITQVNRRLATAIANHRPDESRTDWLHTKTQDAASEVLQPA